MTEPPLQGRCLPKKSNQISVWNIFEKINIVIPATVLKKSLLHSKSERYCKMECKWNLKKVKEINFCDNCFFLRGDCKCASWTHSSINLTMNKYTTRSRRRRFSLSESLSMPPIQCNRNLVRIATYRRHTCPWWRGRTGPGWPADSPPRSPPPDLAPYCCSSWLHLFIVGRFFVSVPNADIIRTPPLLSIRNVQI